MFVKSFKRLKIKGIREVCIVVKSFKWLKTKGIREERSIPAFNPMATSNALNNLTTVRTSPPFLFLHKHPKGYIIGIPSLSSLTAPKTSMPRNFTLEAKKLFTFWTLGFLNGSSTLIDNQSRAIFVGTVTSMQVRKRCVAKTITPFIEEFCWKDCLAYERI